MERPFISHDKKIVSLAKKASRKLGELLKMFGRRLEHFGDNITPRWSRKLFNKCYLADAEIHIGSNVFVGGIDAIYQENSGKDSLLVVRLKAGTLRNGVTLVSKIFEGGEFKLIGYGPPVIIKENGCDCVWTGHKNGYLAIFFN